MNSVCLKSEQEFNEVAAKILVENIQVVLLNNERCSLAIPGGSTPYSVFKELVNNYSNLQIWNKLDLFWVDERCVSSESTESNFGNSKKYLLDKFPEINYYRMKGELTPKDGAADYQNQLKTYFKQCLPKFDIMILGMGDDGHLASLFPNYNSINETHKWVVNEYVSQTKTSRLSLTIPVIKNSSSIIVWIKGSVKKSIFEEIQILKNYKYPIQKLESVYHKMQWIIQY